MELELIRTYHPDGTNGTINYMGNFQCHSIELPWLDNQHKVSCIPEGRYELKKRYSPKFKDHLIVMDVKDRSEILIHPANDALKELKGCIAPVSELTGAGMGTGSVIALNKLMALVCSEQGTIYLTIKKRNHDN